MGLLLQTSGIRVSLRNEGPRRMLPWCSELGGQMARNWAHGTEGQGPRMPGDFKRYPLSAHHCH